MSSGQSYGLTERETEIVIILAEGLCNKEIARRLGITEGTVKAHLSNIYTKLGISKRFKLAVMFKAMTDAKCATVKGDVSQWSLLAQTTLRSTTLPETNTSGTNPPEGASISKRP